MCQYTVAQKPGSELVPALVRGIFGASLGSFQKLVSCLLFKGKERLVEGIGDFPEFLVNTSQRYCRANLTTPTQCGHWTPTFSRMASYTGSLVSLVGLVSIESLVILWS